jgi:hypothetical protein
MSVTAHEPGPASTGGGPGPVDAVTPGVRPRPGRVCTAPRLARRMDRRPSPRLRALHAVPVPAVARADPEPAPDLATPAWEAALGAARSQVGPVALRVLSAVAEVLDGVRPVAHLAGVCPEAVLTRLGARVPAGRRPGRTRVRGLRMCPLVTAGSEPVPAVEVAAALSAATRTRAVAARFELRDDGWRLVELVVG